MIEAPIRTLLVGSGGREHAFAWKIAEDAKRSGQRVGQSFAPGNSGTAKLGRNLDGIGAMDINRQVDYARDNGVGLVIYGPEAPLIAGAVDEMREAGILAFGPSQKAAMLEGSKVFTTRFAWRNEMPIPPTRIFRSYEAAQAYMDRHDPRKKVIKVDGEALGKGVFLPESRDEADQNLRDIMVEGAFGKAGERVLVQNREEGREVSVIVMVSKNSIALLPTARDFKRAYNHDKGLNTGGMGAYTPNDALSNDELDEIIQSIILPAQRGMIEEHMPFFGLMYAGVMLTANGPRLLEFNVRGGDAETQAQVPRLTTPLLPAMIATIRNRLTPEMVRYDNRASVAVVIASDGYPGKYKKGMRIDIADELPKDVLVFHAGTKQDENGELVTNGGRVLTVVGTGDTIEQASEAAYKPIESGDIFVDGAFYRTDIGRDIAA